MNRSRRPSDGRCASCGIVTMDLVWDHCHDCGQERGWTCQDCNVAMSEHAIHYWEGLTRYLAAHSCSHTPMFSTVQYRQRKPTESPETRRVYFGNGSGDPRYIYVSKDPGYVTVEQMAAIIGVAAGTARDALWGRSSKRRHDLAIRRNDTLLIPKQTAIAYLTDRWSKAAAS